MHSSSLKRRLGVAIATAGIVSALSSVVLPADKGSPPDQQKQAAQAQKMQAEEMRRRGDELGHATYRDSLRSAEHRRPPDHLARDAARALIRRP